MKTFIHDIKYYFIPNYGAIAQIILANVGLYLILGIFYLVVWLAGVSSVFDFVFERLTLPSSIERLLFRPWSILTYQFLHLPSNIFHIAFNMLWLFWIGAIYRNFARDRVIWLTYIICGLAGGALFVLAYNVLPPLRTHEATLHGASAAVMGIVCATAALAPNYRLMLLFFGAVKLKWLVLAMVVLDLLMLPTSNTGGYISHIGGALTGLLFVKLRYSAKDFSSPLEQVRAFFRKKAKKPIMRIVLSNNNKPDNELKKPSQQEIDRILDRIRLVGYDGLSKEEKQTLFNASQE